MKKNTEKLRSNDIVNIADPYYAESQRRCVYFFIYYKLIFPLTSTNVCPENFIALRGRLFGNIDNVKDKFGVLHSYQTVKHEK